MLEILAGNQFASGGLMMMVLGAAGSITYSLAPRVYDFVKNRIIVSFDIPNGNDVFYWISMYLKDKKYVLDPNTYDVCMKKETISSYRYLNDDDEKNAYYFVPGTGFYIGKYKNKFFWFIKTKEKRSSTEGKGRSNADSYLENFYIYTFKNNKEIIHTMIEEAKSQYNSELNNKTQIITANSYGEWDTSKEMVKRDSHSVILANNLQEDIIQDAKDFLNSEEFYANLGINYKKSYLFYGPPGTGKTSLVKALAGALNQNLYILPISEFASLNNFMSLIGNIKPNSIVLMEDIDSFFEVKDKTESESKINYRDFLNILDGVLTPESVIFCFTTNHIEKLPNNFRRSQRIDVEKYIGYLEKEQTFKLIKHYLNDPTLTEEAASNILSQLKNNITPAQLQGHYLNYRDDREGFLNNNILASVQEDEEEIINE